VLIEVKSIAFGMSRYSTRWHLDGATWTERRAAEAVKAKERDAAAAAIDAEVFAGVVPPPMQTQIQRMDGMSSAVIGGFCEHSPVVHELVAKFADMAAKETAKARSTGGSSKRPHHTRGTAYDSDWPQGQGATSTKTKSRACPT
jgi:hypothetical protein